MLREIGLMPFCVLHPALPGKLHETLTDPFKLTFQQNAIFCVLCLFFLLTAKKKVSFSIYVISGFQDFHGDPPIPVV